MKESIKMMEKSIRMMKGQRSDTECNSIEEDKKVGIE